MPPRKGRQKRRQTLSDDESERTQTPGWLQDFLAQMAADNKRREKEHHRLLELMAAPQTPTPVRPAMSGLSSPACTCSDDSGADHRGNPPKLPAVLPPPALESSVTLLGFVSWRALWDDYAMLTRLGCLSRREQVTLLRSSLSLEMRSMLEFAVGIDDDSDMEVDAWLDAIHDFCALGGMWPWIECPSRNDAKNQGSHLMSFMLPFGNWLLMLICAAIV